jgi:uncharacterized OsmC-like protein
MSTRECARPARPGGSGRAIDPAEVARVRSAIEVDPAQGRCRFRARNRGEDRRHSRTFVTYFEIGGQVHVRAEPAIIAADAPRVMQGEERGAAPLDLALAALLACMTTTLMIQAAASGIEIRGVESRAEGDLDLRGLFGLADVRTGFEGVRLAFTFDADVPQRTLAALLRSALASSPMVDLFRNGTRVEARVEPA